MKLGIHHDLAATLGEVEHLNVALGYCTRNIGDLKAQKVGAKRVDLDGNEAGSEEQALNAQRAIAGLRAKWKQKGCGQAEAASSRWPGAEGSRQAAPGGSVTTQRFRWGTLC